MVRERATRVSTSERTGRVHVQDRSGKVRQKPTRDEDASRKVRPRNLRVNVEATKKSTPRPRVSVRERLRGIGARLSPVAQRLKKPALFVLRTLSLLAALAGAVAVGRLIQHHMTSAPAFAIDVIDIKGLGRMTRAEVLGTAGIDIGTNVFAKSPEDVRARLLAHPWIASATVSRRLPSRFDIEIREREPVALLVVEPCPARDAASPEPSCDDPSSLYLVSDEGTIFKRLEGQDPADLPVITGFDRKRLAQDRESEQRLLKEAVALLSEYRSAGLYTRLPIGEIHVEPGGAFSLYVGDTLTHVRLGAPPFAQKLKRMKKVFERLDRERTSAEYVYLDNELRPDRVTVRLR